MQKWMIPCNIKNFDVVEHFKNNKTAFFKKNRALAVGDEVYIYVAKPYSEVKYKGRVTRTGVTQSELGQQYKVSRLDESTFVEVELLIVFPEKSLPGNLLKEHGLGQVVNQQIIRGETEQFIASIEHSLN